MSQLEFVKKYPEEHLKKGFIEMISASYLSLILLTKKPGGGIRFYIDYQKLNKFTNKHIYSIPLIEEIVA